jgi:hypothetical protein
MKNGKLRPLALNGGYGNLDHDGCWWKPLGRTFFNAVEAIPELAEARLHFFMPRRTTNPFGHTVTDYDGNDLLAFRITDAVGDTLEARNNYRTLKPDLITDPNGNRSQCVLDELGMVIATANMGKASENLGDSLNELSEVDLEQFVNDPKRTGPRVLGTATKRILYDLNCYR